MAHVQAKIALLEEDIPRWEAKVTEEEEQAASIEQSWGVRHTSTEKSYNRAVAILNAQADVFKREMEQVHKIDMGNKSETRTGISAKKAELARTANELLSVPVDDGVDDAMLADVHL